ncbi:MAG TPA: DUF11 domain-containing protein [bacterium]|nr:DUF11 domain-containing protein [bacterium]
MAASRGRSSIISTMVFFIILFFSSLSFAGNPQVESITMVPPSPNFGDRITVTVVYCGQLYNKHEIGIAISTVPVPSDARLSGIGQAFIVSRAGINVHTATPAASPGGEIGWTAHPNPNGGTANCQTCGSGSNDGMRITVTYGLNEPLTVPSSEYFPGCDPENLYLHVVMKDNNLNDGEYHNRDACQVGTISWTIPLLDPFLNIHKRVEGVLQLANDLVLFSIDYSYANGQPRITDAIPNIPGTTITLVSAGPLGFYSGPAPGSVVTPGQGLTWNLPNRTGLKGSVDGTVWFLLRVNSDPTMGGLVTNTAGGTMGSISRSSSTSLVVGQPAVTITKSQSTASPLYGENITYYLSYQINGSQLVAYQSFDDLPLGTYYSTPPTGWRFRPSVTNGTWYIEDPCGTGDRVIRGNTSISNDYPGLLYEGYTMQIDAQCLGIITTEVMIDPSGETTGQGYEGADSLVIIRDDGLAAGGRAYGLVLSVDNFIGTNPNGNIGFQRCGATPYGPYTAGTCMWPESVPFDIRGNAWYRVKIQTGGVAGNVCEFRAKVWEKGDPEPAGWTIQWTDTNCVADGFHCTGSGRTWYAGVAQQGGEGAYTQDSYNNFTMLKPRTSANTTLYDTIPAGITYQGEQGPRPRTLGPTPMIGWDLGLIYDEGGTYTWWGRVDTCDPITNRAAIDGSTIAQILSNEVVAYPICQEETEIIKTANVASAGLGDRITWTIAYCNTGMSTITNYRIWDTRPASMSYLNCSGGTSCGQAGNIISWNIGTLNPGQCGEVRWWGNVTSVGFTPGVFYREFYAYHNRQWMNHLLSRGYDCADIGRR